MKRFFSQFLQCFFLVLFTVQGFGQFYNGHRMSFGKNRIQYHVPIWNFYRFEQYDIYYHQEGEGIARYVHFFARDEIERIENLLNYQLEKRIIFIVYNSLSDFRQSNIGLVSGNDETNIGGTTRITRNKVAVYYEGDTRKLEKQISESITEIIVNEMFYGNALTENITSSVLISLPAWYLEGLKAFIANRWDPETENRVCDGILTGRYKKFNHLTGSDATDAGHSFWRYIAVTYGINTIPAILYLTKINKNVRNAFLYVLGSPLKELTYDWQGYYLARYEEAQKKTSFPEQNRILRKTKPRRVYYQLKINPRANQMAYVTNESGRYIIWLYDSRTRTAKKILRRGHRLDQITDYSYPCLAWHPSGKVLTFMIEEKGSIYLYFYTPATRELTARHFLYFDKVLDYSFSSDGLKFVMSAVRNGKTDIYVFTLASGTFEQITNDYADDLYPRFVNNDEAILFCSNRNSDTLTTETMPASHSKYLQLYLYDYAHKNNLLKKAGSLARANHLQPLPQEANHYFFLSDATGIINRYYATFDSTISFIDTAIHYRYFSTIHPVTNYSSSILEHDMNDSSLTEILFKKGRYHLFSHPVTTNTIDPKEMPVLAGEDKLFEPFYKKPTPRKPPAALSLPADTSLLFSDVVDINNYIFEKEKIKYLQSLHPDTLTDNSTVFPRPRIYETYFYTNYIVNQIDFSFLNNSYQPFTGGAPYYNPGLNFFFKLGTNDLMEDYRITGGIRFAGDFESNECVVSFENLKRRKDHQWIFHRQVFKNYTDNDDYIKTQTNEIMWVERYPFSQVLALKSTYSLRHDRNVYMANPYKLSSIEQPDDNKIWAGYKAELIFDNTKNLGLNLYSGLRFKLFGEAYARAANFSNLFVVGADFRHYLRIHRNLIFASRIAGSSSFGHSKLIYYMGGVDNWTNIYFRREESFDKSVPVDPKANYAFQALATNMRGFIQNIRNGNNFVVINTELRWPVIRYFANHPIANNFLNNFQLAGFFDVGTAWAGISPWAGKNAYDKQIIDRNVYRITIDSNRDPIVAGYGFGIRSQLLGYFVRLDWAWGIENYVILKPVFYLSLSLDF